MAFHSAQGPQLGLPQMIQSRPQFGYSGALLVWVFAYLQYAGFNVFNTILAGKAMHATVHGAVNLWVVIATVIAFVIALVGYDLIHQAERYLTYATLVIVGIFTVVVLTLHYPAGSFDLSGFKWTPFLGQFGVVAGYQISWAIYVSDYSRYLPPTVTVRKTFYWTYWGSALGGGWMMILGALLAGWAGAKFDGSRDRRDPVGRRQGLQRLRRHRAGPLGAGSDLGHRPQHVRRIADPHQRHRLVQAGQADDERAAGDDRHHRGALARRRALRDRQLPVQLQQLPAARSSTCSSRGPRSTWSTTTSSGKGHYAIAEIFNPDGMYGRWGWRGIVAYLIGFAVMIPFFSVGTLFTGFDRRSTSWTARTSRSSSACRWPAILYWVFSRSIDVEAETKVAEAEAAELETAAAQHELP